MSAPPFERTLAEGMGRLRDALRHAPEAARDEARQVMESDELVDRVLGILVPTMDQRFRRKYYPRMMFGLVIILLIMAVGGTIIFNQLSMVNSKTAADLAAQSISLKQQESTLTAFQQQLDIANAKLIAQGQPPVASPPDPQPNAPDQVRLATAAATASTLAQLPATKLAKPNADDLGKAIADYLVLHPVTPLGPTPDQISAGLATYFADHPVKPGPAGPTGSPGPSGPPPTSDEIMAAFTKAAATNPQILCPRGTYGSRQLMLVGGGSTMQYGCFGDDVPPPPTTTPTPMPTPDPTTTEPPTTQPTTTQASPAPILPVG